LLSYDGRCGRVSIFRTFIGIRKIRNKIAHEYVEEDDLLEMYRFVLQSTPVLFDTVDRIENYCERYSPSKTQEEAEQA
jgi:hypothetical protein